MLGITALESNALYAQVVVRMYVHATLGTTDSAPHAVRASRAISMQQWLVPVQQAAVLTRYNALAMSGIMELERSVLLAKSAIETQPLLEPVLPAL